MFTAHFLAAGASEERTLTAQTEAELRIELRLVSHAGGVIDNGKVIAPGGQTIATWSRGANAWLMPDGAPWGVE